MMMGEDSSSGLVQSAKAPLTAQQAAKLKHDKSVDAFHARIASIKRNVDNINSQLTTGKKIQEPVTDITSNNHAVAVEELAKVTQVIDAIKPEVLEKVAEPKRDEVLIKNLLTYSELLAVVAKHPGAQVLDERDQVKGYLWVRQAGGIFNANPKLVKWLAEHKFLLKAEKGWFFPVL